MSKILVVKALTNSEWDNVEALVFPITDSITKWLKSYNDIINNFVETLSDDDKLDFNHITLFSDLGDYVIFDDTFEFKGENPFELVDGDSINIEELAEPENSLDLRMVKFYKNGFAFSCEGKHTGEDFWTERVPYSFFD